MTTIITSVNFKRYSKKLYKSFEDKNIQVSLSSAKEILAKTLGFKDFFNASNHFKEHLSIAMDDTSKYYTRFLKILFDSNIKLEEKISHSIFNDFLGLNLEHVPSIMQIISELKILVMNEKVISRCALYVSENSELIGFTIISKSQHLLMVLPNLTFFEKEIVHDKIYPNLNKKHSRSLSKLLKETEEFDNLLENSKQENYLYLLEQLFSYEQNEIKKNIQFNTDKFFCVIDNSYCLKYSRLPKVEKSCSSYFYLQASRTNRFYIIIEDSDLEKTKKESFMLTDKDMQSILSMERKLTSIDFGLPFRSPSLESRFFIDFEVCHDIYKQLDINLNYRIAECNNTNNNEYLISKIYAYDINKNLISIGN